MLGVGRTVGNILFWKWCIILEVVITIPKYCPEVCECTCTQAYAEFKSKTKDEVTF